MSGSKIISFIHAARASISTVLFLSGSLKSFFQRHLKVLESRQASIFARRDSFSIQLVEFWRRDWSNPMHKCCDTFPSMQCNWLGLCFGAIWWGCVWPRSWQICWPCFSGNTCFLWTKVFLDNSLLATVHHNGVKSSGIPGDAGSTSP